MDRNNHDTSAFSVPGSMQDVTLLSTPLPKATSTATKRKSLILDKDSEFLTWKKEDELDVDFKTKLNLTDDPEQDVNEPKRLSPPLISMNDSQRKLASVADAYKTANEVRDQANKEMTEIKARLYRGNTSITVSGLSGLQNYRPENNFQYIFQPSDSGVNLSNNNLANSMNEPTSSKEDFEFLVPQAPAKRQEKFLQKDTHGLSKYKTESQVNMIGSTIHDVPKLQSHYSNDLPEKLSSTESELRLANDQRNYDEDRYSVSSSTSSLGILTPEELNCVKDKPLMKISEAEKLDFSLRLAKELNLDTSQIKDGELDISDVLCNRMKEKISSAKREANKENRSDVRSSGSSDYGSLYGYGSDNSTNSKNNTAKEFPNQTPRKECSINSNKKPLSEQNIAPPRDSLLRKSAGSNGRLSYQMRNGKLSLASNPFSDCSKMSVASDEFRSADDAVERLMKDEEAWRGGFDESRRTLSGIYGDCDISIRTQGEKMSISSFLRSGSGPLGCLEKDSGGTPRPTFGRPVVSPEKKSKPRPILPPLENKLTFVLADEEPTKDTADPWHPKSLLEQHSLIHSNSREDSREIDESEVSVPSLSCIGQLLTEMQGKMSAEDVMNRLLEAPKSSGRKNLKADVSRLSSSILSNCADRENLKSVSLVVGGGSSLNQGNESNNSFLSLCDGETRVVSSQNTTWTKDNQSVITNDDSITPSVCNVTDFDGEEEDYVCVLTPESMDFDIFNEHPREQRYHISKTCYLNSQKCNSAALVHLSEDSLSLKPGEKRVVNVTVAAAVEGCIKIKIEVIRFDTVTHETETNNVFGKLVAEVPKISLLSPPAVEMKPSVDSIGGEVHGTYFGTMELRNDGRSVVPVKLVLTHGGSKELLERFYFNNDSSQSLHFSLEPGKILSQPLYCQSPPILKCSTTATARVDVYLDTPLPVSLKSFQSISFRAQLKHNFFSAPTILHVAADRIARCELHNNSQTSYTIEASAASGYFVQPTTFTVQPHQSFVFHAGYHGGPNKSGMVMLKTKAPEETVHFINIVLEPSIAGSNRSSFNMVTPQTSRSTSPTSPCSSTSLLGNLRLACTHKELVWGGCALQQRVIRTCTIKNLSNHREKLLLKITDQHKCFKILNENNGLASEVKLSLQPLESRQLCVVMLAGSTGAKWGHLTVARLSNPDDKKILFLYAFGGKAKVSIEGVLQDPEQHMWLYLDSGTLSSSFVLTNVGDYSAFVKISEGVTATTVGGGISIAPPEQILLPGQSLSIEISLSVTLERLEYLLAQPSQTAVCITRLTVTHGDESTRRRLTRLSRLDPKLASKLSQLSQLLPQSSIPDLDKLGEDCSCAETLWLEDVNEWTIGVLVKRSVLESLKLDTSYEYVDLATTVIH